MVASIEGRGHGASCWGSKRLGRPHDGDAVAITAHITARPLPFGGRAVSCSCVLLDGDHGSRQGGSYVTKGCVEMEGRHAILSTLWSQS